MEIQGDRRANEGRVVVGAGECMSTGLVPEQVGLRCLQHLTDVSAMLVSLASPAVVERAAPIQEVTQLLQVLTRLLTQLIQLGSHSSASCAPGSPWRGGWHACSTLCPTCAGILTLYIPGISWMCA